MKLVWPSAKLLQAAAGASLRAYHHVTHNVLPLLLEQYTKHPQVRVTPGSAIAGLSVPAGSGRHGGAGYEGGHPSLAGHLLSLQHWAEA